MWKAGRSWSLKPGTEAIVQSELKFGAMVAEPR
jgi:hypothetical protein